MRFQVLINQTLDQDHSRRERESLYLFAKVDRLVFILTLVLFLRRRVQVEKRLPRIWMPSQERLDLRVLLRHRDDPARILQRSAPAFRCIDQAGQSAAALSLGRSGCPCGTARSRVAALLSPQVRQSVA